MAQPDLRTPTFPTVPPSTHYDAELDYLCRVAVWIGVENGDEAPLTYLALLLAFMAGEDPVSGWFRTYTSPATRDLLFERLRVKDTSMGSYRLTARSLDLPPNRPLFSRSTSELFGEAEKIAELVTRKPGAQWATIGVRHVMSAYVFRPQSNHLQDLAGLALDLRDWQTNLMAFLRQAFPDEHWNWLIDPNAPSNPADMTVNDVAAQVPNGGTTLNLDAINDPKPSIADTFFTPNTGTLHLQTPTNNAGSRPLGGIATPPATSGTGSTVSGFGTSTRPSPESSSTPASPAPPKPPPPDAPPIPPVETASPNIYVSTYTADNPDATADDALDIDTEAAGFARIVAARAILPPLAIGIFGEWGSGKTYFMRRIQSQVDTLRSSPQATNSTEPLFYSDIVQIRFNAWHYIETNLWASLVEYIFSALDTWIQSQAGGDSKSTDLVFSRLATAQQLQIDALEKVVQLRAQQHSAELRAERAHAEYAAALASSERLRATVSARAMLATFLQTDLTAKANLKTIADGLAIPELKSADERLDSVIAESRTTAGRARLVTRSLTTKLGTWQGAVAIACIILAFPLISASLNLLAQVFPNSTLERFIHSLTTHTTLALLVIAGIVQYVLKIANATVNKLSVFDAELQKSIDQQVEAAKNSRQAKDAVAAQQDLLKAQQGAAAADRALTDANAKLAAARQDFESGTARARLNAFVRAKVTDGNYAKHLGIIASIRKDFVQLAGLMDAANDPNKENADRQKLKLESTLRVQRFLSWLNTTSDIQLTAAEVRGLFALLEPDQAIQQFDQHRQMLAKHFEDDDDALTSIRDELVAIKETPVPRFSRIVLYVDDLDRCPPNKVVEVLQAVHLLLCFPLFVVIVAVDARWVSRALHDRFPNLLAQTPFSETPSEDAPINGATADDYLEKIFQIPYWVRPMKASLASDYVQKIAGADRASPRIAPSPATQDVAPIVPADATPPHSAALSVAEQPGEMPPSAPAPDAPVAPPPIPPIIASTPLTTSMSLSDWEIDALRAFAPFVGRTPRHAIRFVNIYRLIKTSLSPTFDVADLEQGGSARSRALIPQLAIVNGAPYAAPDYFRILQDADGGQLAQLFLSSFEDSEKNSTWVGDPVIRGVFDTWFARESTLSPTRAAINVSDLQFMAPTVERYSFTARLAP